MSQDNDETFMYHDYETNFYVDNAVDDMINPVPELDPNTLVDQAGFVNQTGSNKSMGSDQLNSRINSTSSSYNNLSGINSTKNNPSISFTIPGGFKENDYMEIDDSPPFTIELDLYFDSQSNNNNNQSVDDYKQRETLFPHNQYFIRQFKQSDQTQNPNNLSPNSNIPLSNVNTPNPSYKNQFETPRSVSGSLVNTSVFFQDNYDQVSENHSQFGDTPIYSNYNNEGDVSHFDNHMRNPSIDSHFNGPASISNNPNHYLQDLSPLTTNTSLTHSVNSIHSTQPSFLSAQQYLSRHSIELTNSNINPVEYLANTRNSIDSGNSSHRQPRNNNRYLSFTNSISNYIPFMGDKNGQRTGNSPGNGGPPSPISNSSGSSAFFHSQPTPRQQPKHLIRSIFKSNPSQQESPGLDALTPNDDILLNRNNGNEIFVNDEGLNIEGFVNDGVVDNTDFVAVHDNELPVIVQNKKIKKPKRSLFTRFKTPNKIESDDQTSEIINDGSSKHSGNTSFNQELDENDPNAVNTSETASSQSIRTNVQAGSSLSNINNPLESSNSESSQQPNYAALFENVGKRKKNKNSAFKKNNKKSEKVEGEYTDEESNNELHVNEKDLFDSSFSKSTSITSHSQFLHDHNLRLEEGEEESDSILTNASKKILGSKLMKRKVNKRQPDVTASIIKDSNEAKVGLKTLDLPEAVQAYPTSVVNAKSRTRGRKENKEADMVDSSKIYLCSYCSRRFKRQEHLKRHFRSLHTFDKPFDCHICHKKFSRSDNLNQHLKTHKEEEGESPEISTVSS